MGNIYCIPDRQANLIRLMERTDPEFYRGNLGIKGAPISDIIKKKEQSDSIREFLFNYALLPPTEYSSFIVTFENLIKDAGIKKLTVVFQPYDEKYEKKVLGIEKASETKRKEEAEQKRKEEEEQKKKEEAEKKRKEEAEQKKKEETEPRKPEITKDEKNVEKDIKAAEKDIKAAEKEIKTEEKEIKTEEKNAKVRETELQIQTKVETKKPEIEAKVIDRIFPEEHIHRFFEVLRKRTSLQRLNLSFDKLMDNDIEVFVKELHSFFQKCNIGKLELNLDGLIFKKSQFKLLFEGLKHLNKLRKFNLCFGSAGIFEMNEGAPVILEANDLCLNDIEQFFRYNKHLKNFKFSEANQLNEAEQRNKIIVAMLKGLKNNHSLNILNLKLIMEDKEIITELGNVIKSCPNLTEIRLTNSGEEEAKNEVDFEAFKALTDGIMEAKSLQTLDLIVKNLGLNDQCVHYFVENIGKKWIQYKYCHLDFSSLPLLTVEGSEFAAKVYQEIQNQNIEQNVDIEMKGLPNISKAPKHPESALDTAKTNDDHPTIVQADSQVSDVKPQENQQKTPEKKKQCDSKKVRFMD